MNHSDSLIIVCLNLFQPDDICSTGDCFIFLYRVYGDCGYNGLDIGEGLAVFLLTTLTPSW